jgi:hypothetical protein
MSNTQVAIDAIHQLAIADEEIQKLRAENEALRESLISEKYQSAELLCEVSELKTKLTMLYEPLNDDVIKKTYLATGFKIQEGLTDLKPYVYKSAHAIHQAILARIKGE